MDEWNEEFLAVEVERELEKHRAEREKWNLDATATGKKSSFGKMFLYFILGMIIFKLFGELLFLFK
jgi:hypothetical protein